MNTTQSHVLANDLQARINRLCECCQRLRGGLIQVALDKEANNVNHYCQHYNSFQDLLRGTLGGCHFCAIVCDYIKVHCKRHSTQVASWLKSVGPQDPSAEEASVTKMITYTRVYDYSTGREIQVFVAIEVEHPCSLNITVRLMDSPATPVRSYTEPQLSTHVCSDAHYRLIQKWYQNCTDGVEHPACNTTSKYERPTRLIDLDCYQKSDGSQQDVRLVDGTSSTKRYAALSYCWGAGQQPKLLRTNLQQFYDRILLKDLSQVSRDAITVCRRLSIPFLWIDALCIIQGEGGDFATEAPRMQDVYAGSKLTIVAADSGDTSEAFLVQRFPLQWLDCTLAGQIEGSPSKRLEITAKHFCADWRRRNKPGHYHIDSRAWCLQERLMSPRSIFFGQKGIHWECRQGLSCEFSTDIRRGPCLNPEMARCLKAEYAVMHRGKLDAPEAQSIWCRLVEAYSEMHLSYAEDVLVAISGVFSVFKVQLRSESTYGLWVDFLVKALLWYQHPPDDTTKYHSTAKYLPSWSWASAHGIGITMPCMMKFPDKKDEFYSADPLNWPTNAGFDIQFLQGPRDTRLCIRGYLSRYTESKRYHEDSSSSSSGSEGGVGEWYREERLDFEASETDLFCLLLICQYSKWRSEEGISKAGITNYGLILTPVNQKERLYRRVGYIDESRDYPLDLPASSWVQGKFAVGLWAPLEEEQEIYIV